MTALRGSSVRSLLYLNPLGVNCQRYGRRCLHINPAPAVDPSTEDVGDDSLPASGPPDARFEVLGAPFSLLSVSLAPSQTLYTRRGSLVALNGTSENVRSTLSVLEPFRRGALGIPFLHQKISSTTPITALISSRSPLASFAVVYLDGRQDWIVAQRKGLLAWSGETLSITPQAAAHWGNSRITGRGIVGLAGKGQVFQLSLKSGEQYVVHPSNVLAYTLTRTPPFPYRLRSLTLQVPRVDLGALIPDTKFFREIAKSGAWKTLSDFLFSSRTWLRRTIWGDRLFLRFIGPTTVLIQSHGSQLRDVLTQRDVNELADSPLGAVHAAANKDLDRQDREKPAAEPAPVAQPTKVSFATVEPDKKVSIKAS